MDDSLQKTVARVQRVIGQRKVGFQIDPQAFDRFTITAAAFLRPHQGPVRSDALRRGHLLLQRTAALAAGDVSIDYALRFIQKTAPKFSREAQTFSRR